MRMVLLIFFLCLSLSVSKAQNISDSLKFEKEKISFTAYSGDSAKSPAKAVLLSAVLPGLGQFYNKSYWKIPIVYGLGAFFVYEYIQYDKDFDDYSKKYEASKTTDNPSGSYYLKLYREHYRDKRDSFIWYGGFLYLINILDAFVDAHLYSFDVNENLSAGINPGISKNALFLKIRF